MQLYDPPHWTLLSKPLQPKPLPNSTEILAMRETPKEKPNLDDEENSDNAAKINRIRMMQLELTEEVNEVGEISQPWNDFEEEEEEETLLEVSKVLNCAKNASMADDNSEKDSLGKGKKICAYTITDKPIENPLAEELREKL